MGLPCSIFTRPNKEHIVFLILRCVHNFRQLHLLVLANNSIVNLLKTQISCLSTYLYGQLENGNQM